MKSTSDRHADTSELENVIAIEIRQALEQFKVNININT